MRNLKLNRSFLMGVAALGSMVVLAGCGDPNPQVTSTTTQETTAPTPVPAPVLVPGTPGTTTTTTTNSQTNQ